MGFRGAGGPDASPQHHSAGRLPRFLDVHLDGVLQAADQEGGGGIVGDATQGAQNAMENI